MNRYTDFVRDAYPIYILMIVIVYMVLPGCAWVDLIGVK